MSCYSSKLAHFIYISVIRQLYATALLFTQYFFLCKLHYQILSFIEHWIAINCFTPAVVALYIPPSGATATVTRQKSTQSCYNLHLTHLWTYKHERIFNYKWDIMRQRKLRLTVNAVVYGWTVGLLATIRKKTDERIFMKLPGKVEPCIRNIP